MKLAFEIGPTIFPPAQIGNTPESAATLVSNIILILTSFAFAISIIFIIIAGLKIVTASGDEKKMASATGTLTYAIIGLVVTILAFAIVRVVQAIIGSNVAI
jgi:hypothetical protein